MIKNVGLDSSHPYPRELKLLTNMYVTPLIFCQTLEEHTHVSHAVSELFYNYPGFICQTPP